MILSAAMNRRRFLPLAAAGVAACRRDSRRVIGVVPQGRSHLFWQTIHAGAAAGGQERNVEILWNAPLTETDYNGQLQILDAMINRRVDAIALAPIDRKAMVGVVERAVGQKIPVVIFDSGLEGDAYVSWVATDNFAAGQLAADRMGEMLGGKGKVCIVAVQPGVASSVAREAGFEERVQEKFPGIQILDKRYGMADFSKSLAIAENMLTAHPGLDGLFASNESSTVGAAQALKGRKTATRLVGFDFSPNLIEDLSSGLIDSLVVQNPFEIGRRSVVAAVDAVEGKRVEKVQKLAPRLIRKGDLGKPDVERLLNPDLKKYLG